MGQPQSLAAAQGIVTILQAMPATLLTTCGNLVTASGSPQVVTPLSMIGITVGVPLQVDVANSEVVTPSAASSSTFTAVFTKNHLPNWTIGSGGTLFSATSVFLGTVQDPTDIVPCVSVAFVQRHIERFDAGFKVNSHPTFLVETLADLTDGKAAEIFILNAADILVSVFMARATIPGASQVYMVYGGQFKKDIPPDLARYKVFPNGRVYRVHQMQVQAVDQFNIQFN